ncbi:hypothetical protein [Phyllobacterium leguminum]|uniref:hypothetical protein n=1 Tax=Phyllobacterium leguminum TaxID=314237 RepID=UPI0015E88C7C|nr:hypothetical protein [Phyllobacterium leguminum]
MEVFIVPNPAKAGHGDQNWENPPHENLLCHGALPARMLGVSALVLILGPKHNHPAKASDDEWENYEGK